VFELLVAPGGLDVVIGEAVIFDADEGVVAHADDVILAVGVDPSRAAAAGLVEKAGIAGAAAVVFKPRGGDMAPLVEAARTAGIAVLAAPVDTAWGQLHALVRTATAAVGVADAPGGAPIGDLFGLANAVAAMLGGPVTIEDPRSTVLAYSNLDDHEVDDARRATILGRRVPDEWIRRQEDDGVFRRLFREPGVIRIEYPELGIQPRIATAVRAGDEIIGSIWVQEGDTVLGEQAEIALVEAARIAALHLLRHRSRADVERTRRAELLRAALEGRMGADALVEVLGVAPATPLSVIALELPAAASDAAAVAVLGDRVASLVSLYCESYRRPAAVVATGNVVYLVVPRDADDDERVRALAKGICATAHDTLHVDLRAGIGSAVASVADLRASRVEADRVLRALTESAGAPTVAAANDVRGRLVLQYLQEMASTTVLLRTGKLDVLAEHDRQRGTEYIPTLRAFFSALGDVPAAAGRAAVHPNTFRYRMRRLAEVGNLDLDDPVERLVIQLQLHFLRD
jgi:hypothetical protein